MAPDIILDGIELPNDLQWQDEFTGWRTGQQVRWSLTGAMHVKESVRQAGRPITLVSRNSGSEWVAMVTLPTLNALLAHEGQARSTPFTLQLPAHNSGTRTFNCYWRRTDGPAIEFQRMIDIVPNVDGDYFHVTLRLMSAD